MSGAFEIGAENPELYSMTDGIVRPDRNIHLDDVNRLSALDPFWANRGKAIQAYAVLEQALCTLFAEWGGIERDVAGIIFFKITSTTARTAILEKLLSRKHGGKYNCFWKSYLKALRSVDTKRNEIVHWTATTSCFLDGNNVLFVGVSIVPPAYWARTNTTERILSKDLMAFAVKCDVFSRLATMFHVSTRGQADVIEQSWLDIFQRPFLYPLPEDHPLNKPPSAPNSPPQSSPATGQPEG